MERTITTSTSADVPITFSNASITANSVITPYTSKWGIVPTDITTSAGQCVVTIPAQGSEFSLTIRIYIM